MISRLLMRTWQLSYQIRLARVKVTDDGKTRVQLTQCCEFNAVAEKPAKVLFNVLRVPFSPLALREDDIGSLECRPYFNEIKVVPVRVKWQNDFSDTKLN